MNASDSKEKGASKTARIPIKIVAAEKLPKPDWIRVKAPFSYTPLTLPTK